MRDRYSRFSNVIVSIPFIYWQDERTKNGETKVNRPSAGSVVLHD